jgi:sulfate transport system ATP-binding protein
LHGEEVIAFARPHELDIVVGDDGGHGVPAKVQRVLPSGAIARVELTGSLGSNGAAEQRPFEVEITRERLSALNLQPGQAVRLTSSRLRVFPQDGQS